MPDSQPAASWPDAVADMAERSNLTPDTQRLIERYLVTLSSATR